MMNELDGIYGVFSGVLLDRSDTASDAAEVGRMVFASLAGEGCGSFDIILRA